MSVEGGGWTPVPGQEVIEAVHGMPNGHALEHVLEIGEWLDVIELGGGDERADSRPALSTAIGSREEVVLASEAIGRMARSTVLVSSSMRPSLRKQQRASQRTSA